MKQIHFIRSNPEFSIMMTEYAPLKVSILKIDADAYI